MKIGLISDTHNEFKDLYIKNNNDIDVLVLCGDIVTPNTWKYNHSSSARKNAFEQMEFFNRLDKDFNNIPKIQLLGNHEFYHNRLDQPLKILLENAKNFNSTWYIGDNMLITINSVNFYAATLWTNMNNNNPIVENKAKHGMNDFKLIKNSIGENFHPQESVMLHETTMKFFTNNWKHGEKNVVLTHHLPSFSAIDNQYKSSDLNGAYASNLDNWILDHNPVLWCCGHSHNEYDDFLGNTRIVRHPRGYVGYENVDPNYTYKVIEI